MATYSKAKGDSGGSTPQTAGSTPTAASARAQTDNTTGVRQARGSTVMMTSSEAGVYSQPFYSLT